MAGDIQESRQVGRCFEGRPGQFPGSFRIDLQKGVLVHGPRQRGTVAQDVDPLAGLVQTIGVTNVTIDHLHGQVTDVAQVAGAANHAAHTVTSSQKRFDKVRANEAIGPGDQSGET